VVLPLAAPPCYNKTVCELPKAVRIHEEMRPEESRSPLVMTIKAIDIACKIAGTGYFTYFQYFRSGELATHE